MDSALDSSTGSATSADLTVDGQRDPTLDFGFVIDPSAVESADVPEGDEGVGMACDPCELIEG
jgi:serine-aspartate repeat-containing protein C/D/E